MGNNLKLQDTFTVINRTILHNSDRNNLTILYQPIVGAMAINLYFTFWSHLDQTSLLTEVSNFKQLISSMGLSLNEIEEARKYLAHPILSARLIEITEALLEHKNKPAYKILGDIDDMKLKSCMTLFSLISENGSVFHQALNYFFDGKQDLNTLNLIK